MRIYYRFIIYNARKITKSSTMLEKYADATDALHLLLSLSSIYVLNFSFLLFALTHKTMLIFKKNLKRNYVSI